MRRNHRPRQFPEDARHLSLLPQPPSHARPEAHWRHRRNIVIYLIHRQGVPCQLIADAFDLGISRVRTIIRDISLYDRSLVNDDVPHPPAGATRQIVGELPSESTPFKRWRSRRDAVIRVASRMGLSRPLIADVFDLTRTSVQAILAGTARAREASKR
jgi:hypothetical protein